MCQDRITKMKSVIEQTLKTYLYEEGVTLYVAANDNIPHKPNNPDVRLESIDDVKLEGNALLTEIRVVLLVRGKAGQCDVLINGIYQALQPHYVTQHELNVLLMSLHVEIIDKPRRIQKRSIMRYIIEEDLRSMDMRQTIPLEFLKLVR